MATRIDSPARPWFRLASCLVLCLAALYLGSVGLREAVTLAHALESGTGGGDLVKILAYGYSAFACLVAAFFIGMEGRDRPVSPQEAYEFDTYVARWKASQKRRRKTMQETLNDQPVSLAIRHTTLVRAAALLALFGAALLAFGLAVRQGVITSPLLLFVGSAVGIVWILAVMFLAMIKLDRMGAPDKNTS